MSRRRQFEEDEEIQSKRRRGATLIGDVEKKLQEVIGRVGDKNTGSSIEANLDKLTTFLHDDLDKYRSSIIDIVTGCAIYLPNRVTVYTTLVGLLNAKNFNFGGDVVERLIAEQQELLSKQQYQEAQNLAIFLCDLGNSGVLTAQSIGEYLESFISAAFEENVPQVRNDFYIQTVLRCLPWIGKELTEKASEQMENILEAVGKYLEMRNKSHVALLQVWREGSTDQEQEDYLESLSAQIANLKSANWMENHIPRHYIGFENVLQDALQHNLPSFASPEHTPEMIYPYPLVVFRLFQDADCASFSDKPLPGGASIDRFLFEGEISWIIEKNRFNRKSCARELIAFAEENPSVPIGFLLFETIFGQMLRLPHPPYPAIFHCSLILELLKLKSDEYPQILVQTVDLIYQRADSMQPICLDRMVDWFSFHLSNFLYRYTWSDWKDCLAKDSYAGSQIFLREVIEKCRRLGSYEKITSVLPQDFVKIHPCSPEIRYLIDQEDTALFQRSETFTQMFQERQPADAFLNELKSSDDNDELPYNINEFGLFVMVMLKMASKTFSHNFSALFRYQAVLKTICDISEQYQEKLLETLYSCWKTNQQMLMILTDKLLKMQIIDCSSVVAWLFDEKMWQEHDRQWSFEVLNQALEKLTRQINVVEKDIKELTEKVENKGKETMKDQKPKWKRKKRQTKVREKIWKNWRIRRQN
uniref:Nuclear cap-binding protein subunit 1 n=1 Tax=Caenorhabditis tropicalis TaxID=1561998 RepID=A0A1I7UXL3_9PELO